MTSIPEPIIKWAKCTDGDLASADGRFVVYKSYRRTYKWGLHDWLLGDRVGFDTQRDAKAEAQLRSIRPVPFNLAAHDMLISMGYQWQHVPASWEDTGDAENGPDMDGHPAYDLYTDADSEVLISELGCTLYEVRDLELEAMIINLGG